MKPALFACVLITGTLFGRAALAQEPPSPSPEPTPVPLITPAPNQLESPTPAPPGQQLTANPQSVQSNIGVSKSVAIGGASGALTVTVDPKIASVSASGSNVTIAPLMNGRATVHVVDAAGATVDIFLRVAPNAATINRQVLVKVTGDADQNFVQSEINLAVRQAVNANPGTTSNVGLISPPPSPFNIGINTVSACR
ncbi:MAG: hypothetical protein JO233_10190 [Candidatus Eremiobacteraeota bacterium]|nr:hypothetical protein [Candidatus Eremiobacteraeota bacterium]